MSKLEIGLVLQVFSFLEGIWETLNDGDRTDDFDDGIRALKRAFGLVDHDCCDKDKEEEKEG
jgi:hypothetical protein